MYIVKQWVTYSQTHRDEEVIISEAHATFNMKCVVARKEFEAIKKIFGETYAQISHGRNPENGCGDFDSDLFHVTYSTRDRNLFHRIGGLVDACENSYEHYWLPFVATDKQLAEKGLVRDKVGELPTTLCSV